MAAYSFTDLETLDPYYFATSLLIPGNVGQDVGGIQDFSVLRLLGTKVGTPVISTGQSKYGGASLSLNGSSHVSFPSANTIVQAGDFTIECWFYAAAASASMYVYGNFSSNGAAHNALQWQSGGLIWYYAGNTGISMTGAPLSLNTWYHFAGVRVGNALTLYIDGVARGTNTISGVFGTPGTDLRIGNTNWTNNWWWGDIDDFRITRAARYTANFTPPVAEFPWPDLSSTVPKGVGQQLGLLRAAPAEALDSLGLRPKSLSQQAGKQDIYFGGVGQIVGTVKQKGSPDAPLHRRVCLIDEPSRSLIRETWSDAITGAYAFPNVAMRSTYTVLSYDHTGSYRAVIADKQIPELMP